MDLPSTKPYLIRAIYEWCADNGFTPYLAVVVDRRTLVPREHVRDGQIVLNVSMDATNKLEMGNEMITFSARFGGVARNLEIPVDQVAAIYARENGAGMAFEVEEAIAEDEPLPMPEVTGLGAGEKTVAAAETQEGAAKGQGPMLVSSTSDESDQKPEPPEPPVGGRPKLQRIK